VGKRITIAGVLLAGLLPALALASGEDKLHTTLTGKNEVPKTSTKATATATIDLKGGKRQVCWAFKIVGLRGMNAAHIHKGKRGVSGPVFIALGGKFKAKGCASATKAQIEAVEKNPSRYYVNIHTAKFPNGAIRGQL
jgi:hypothetical protein